MNRKVNTISEQDIVNILKEYYKSDDVKLYEMIDERKDRIKNWDEQLEIVAEILVDE